jgi:phosphoglycolate phosphatase-like HAD superfamily hydrolase
MFTKNSLLEFLETAQAVLFDLDGTLFVLPVDWAHIRRHFSDYCMKKFGKPLEVSRFYEIFDFVRKTQGPNAVEYFYRYVQEKELEGVRNNIAEPKWLVTQGLNLIRRKLPSTALLGVVSSNYHQTIVTVLEKSGLSGRFHTVLGRDDVKIAKPSPEGLLKIILENSLQPDLILFTGDDWVDEEAARAAKTRFIYVQELEQLLR